MYGGMEDEAEATTLLHCGWPSTYSLHATTGVDIAHCGWPSTYSLHISAGAEVAEATTLLHCG